MIEKPSKCTEKRAKRKALLKLLILCITLSPFLGTNMLSSNEMVLHFSQAVSSAVITLLVLREAKHFKLTPIVTILILFSAYELVTSAVNGVLTFGVAFSIYFRAVSVTYAVNQFERKDYSFITALSILFAFVILINIPSVINSIGLSEYDKTFLIGGKNALAMIAIPTIFFCYLNNYIRNKRITKISFIIIALSLASLLLSGSSTGIVVGMVMVILLVVGAKIMISPCIYAIAYIASLLLILYPEMIANIPILYDVINNKLNKNLTFTNRAAIWNGAKNYISKNLLGYGRGNQIVYNITYSTNESHNAMLELLLSDGLPGLGLFTIFIYDCVKAKSGITKNSKVLNICFLTIFAMMLIGLMESIINSNVLWWIMATTYCMKDYNE